MTVWDRLIGQPHAVEVLRSAATGGQALAHAWLFSGPPGSGRSLAARALAAAMLCENRTEPGCGTCPTCQAVLAGTHPDVLTVATEKVIISIDEARDLIRVAHQAPTQGNWRIILVEDADRMVERTSNVLLKAIEEPPPHTVWLLCAPSPEDVLITIRSRCRLIHLAIPPATAVAQYLTDSNSVDPKLALTCAYAAQGHIGRARRLALRPAEREARERLLSQMTSINSVGEAVLIAGRLATLADEAAKAATEERNAEEKSQLRAALGASDTQNLPPALRAQMRQLEEDQKRRATRATRDELERFLGDLQSFYRDVLVVLLGGEVPLINDTLADLVRRTAAAHTPATALEIINRIDEARTRLNGNVPPTLVLEALFVELRPPLRR